MKKFLLAWVVFVTTSLNALAQHTIEGTVVDDTRTPLLGVTVMEENTSNGTVTNQDGHFSLSVSGQKAVLVFSSIGMKAVHQQVGKAKSMYIVLEPDAKDLGQVVVIGYGSMLKKDLTGAVGSIDMQDLRKSNSASLLNAMAGKVAGVNVTASSGELGGDVNVVIRGNNSINAGTQPLYVIDGTLIDVNNGEVATSTISGRATFNPLAGINPADIESVQVLKDASATAIYGSAGANGVIVITTKKGQYNKTEVSFDARFGISKATKHVEMLQGQEFADYRFSRFPNSLEWGIDTDGDGKPDRARIFGQEFEDNTSHDWQRELLRTGFSQNYNLSINGSSKSNSLLYSLSGEYLKQNAIAKNNSFTRYTGRFKVEYAPNDKLRIGGNATIARTELYGPVSMGGGLQYNGWLEAMFVYKPFNFKVDPGDPDNGNVSNPAQSLFDSYKKTPLTRILANGFVQYKPLPGLTLRTSLNTGLTFSKSEEWYPSSTSWGYARNGLANVLETTTEQWQSTTTATYVKSFAGGHSLTAMLGFETSSYVWANLNVTAENFPVQTYNPVFDLQQGGAAMRKPSTDKYRQTRMSEFGRLFYSFKDRYLTTLTLRRDGSSKFGADNKYATFPSVALAWKAHNEQFIKGIKAIDELKLRLSAGVSGNDRITPYRSLQRLDNTYYLNLNDAAVLGLAPSEKSNPNLKWESTAQYDLGLDVGLLKHRLGFTLDVYYKRTSDMLLQGDVPGQSGSYKQWQNIGEVENKGVELSINSLNINARNFKWRTTFNISSNRNKIISLGNVTAIPVNINDGTINEVSRLKVGSPIGGAWGYVWDGIYQKTDFDEHGNLKPGVVSIKGIKVKPGDLKYRSLDGDNEVDPVNDKTFISRGEPKFFGGLLNSFEYKDFSLSFFFNYSYGNEVLNISRWKFEGYSAHYNVAAEYYHNRWTETNPSNRYPNIKSPRKNDVSSYYVEDASFLRLQNLTFTYSLPQSVLKPLKITACQFSLSADNLFVLTKYTGFDPEVSYHNKLITGLDNVTYPRSRSFSFGININF